MTLFRRFLLFSPVVVAFFVLLPRLLSSQFGLLDDGLTLRAVTTVSHNWTAAFTMAHGDGRFFPSYYLFFYLVHALVCLHPFLFFAANYAVLAATTAGLIGLVRLLGGTPFQAWAAGIFFVVSGAAVEGFYIGSMKRVGYKSRGAARRVRPGTVPDPGQLPARLSAGQAGPRPEGATIAGPAAGNGAQRRIWATYAALAAAWVDLTKSLQVAGRKVYHDYLHFNEYGNDVVAASAIGACPENLTGQVSTNPG